MVDPECATWNLDMPGVVLATCRAFDLDFPSGVNEISETLREKQLDVSVHKCVEGRFPDGELCIDIPERADGRTVLIGQSLAGGHAETDAAIMSLLAMVRCYREHGAGPIIAIVPHLAYARHDRAIPGERRPVMARLLADLLAVSGLTGLVTLASGAEGELSRLFETTATRLTFVDTHMLRLSMLRPLVSDKSVIVAPDRGAHDAAHALASDLGVAAIAATKRRLGPEAVEVYLPSTSGIGDCRHLVFVDDLITSAATVYMTVRAIRSSFRDPCIDVVVTHLRLTRRGLGRLVELRRSGLIRHMRATDAAGRIVELDGLSITPAVPHLAHALGSWLVRA
jgi:ribose-phosphate pyrophosphokinase